MLFSDVIHIFIYKWWIIQIINMDFKNKEIIINIKKGQSMQYLNFTI